MRTCLLLWVLCVSVRPFVPADLFLTKERGPSYPTSSGHPAPWGMLSSLCTSVPLCIWAGHNHRRPTSFLFFTGASCHRQSGGAVKHCAAAWSAQWQKSGLSYLVCKVSEFFFFGGVETEKQKQQIFLWQFWCLCYSLVCPCILKPKEGSAELQKVNDVSRAYQVKH